MKRTPSKRSTERRKRPRSESKASGRKAAQKSASPALPRSAGPVVEACHHCERSLAGPDARALFVEEELSRIFCSEGCIAAFFAPEIERLEKQYFKRLAGSDLNGEEREGLAHLRWVTLQEPDEIWREKTLAGDYRYTLISEFQPGQSKVWSVCICLFLRGEPSFLYLAFPTKNATMVNQYRRGERVEWVRPRAEEGAEEGASERKSQKAGRMESEEDGETDSQEQPETRSAEDLIDRLADGWTENETFLAQTAQERSEDDIPPSEFNLYQACLEETLETPDEVWSLQMGGEDSPHLYHFIRYYPDETPGTWYIIVARETEEDDEQIEILDAFPTRDSALVDRYRRGEQEIGQVESRPATTRVVH